MTRKIRGWNLQKKQMYSHEQLVELHLEFNGTIQQLINELKFGFEFMESTGKQTKDGLDIYVNDLIKPWSWAYPHQVIYNEDYCRYEMIDRDGDVKLFIDGVNELERVGNVFQDPTWLSVI